MGQADVRYTPENWGPGDLVEDTTLSPLFMLRNSLRLKRLWATWSVRNGRRTVYGPNPAVCLTDMPIAAFIEAGRARAKKGEAMSPIALVLPKNEVHTAGARPVIYGLSSEFAIPTGEEDGHRLLPAEALPLAEQYRYVTLGTYGSVDWTHEREWRWPYRGDMPNSDGTPPYDGASIPGLELIFRGMGAIVRTKKQSRKLLHDILVLSDQGALGRYDFILVGDDISSLQELRDPTKVQEALSAAAIQLAPFRNMFAGKRAKLNTEFETVVNDVNRENIVEHGRELGGCWLWLTDASHEMTRALVLDKRVKINAAGRYLVEIDAFSRELPLSHREELTRRLATLLQERHGLSATYHSVLGKNDPDGVPHYSEPPIENKYIFNHGDDEDDY